MWKSILLASILLFLTMTGMKAQSNQSPKPVDSLVFELIRKHQNYGNSTGTMPGYRIQIFFGSDRNQAQAQRALFLQKYPETPAYLTYQAPNFKVRVGDFKTRLEATKSIKHISEYFPRVFIVPDEVKLPEIQ